MTKRPDTSPEKELVKTFEAAGVVEYLQYLQSGKKMLWMNLQAGIAKGLGLTLGATVVLALLVWLLTKLVNLPVIGEYFENAEMQVKEYVEKTNYETEFAEMNSLLSEINEQLKRQNTSESRPPEPDQQSIED